MDKITEALIEKCRAVTSVEKIALFGSRARGDFNERSDYDIAVFGRLSLAEKLKISEICQEKLPTLHKIDVVFMQEQHDAKFIESINREGIILYDKTGK